MTRHPTRSGSDLRGGARGRPAALLMAALLAWGCGEAASGDEAEAESSSSTTAALLDNVPVETPQSVNVTDLGHNEGDIEAPIYVVEFSDFGCGYCRKFHMETLPSLQEEYIATGKVGWKVIPFVSGLFANSRVAATAGECAARQGRFQAMSQRLYQDQPTWKPSDDPRAAFRRYAKEVGLDLERFEGCLQEDPAGGRIVRANRAAAQLGVRGTPTFFIDGYPVAGAIPLDLFREVLDARLAEIGTPRP